MSALLNRRNLLIAGLCLPAAHAMARETKSDGRPTIKLETEDNSLPISGRDSAGRYVGMVETALGLIVAELDWTVEYLTVPWKRAQQYVRQGSVDGFCTMPTDERSAYVQFAAEPLFTLDSGWVYFAADNPRASELRAVRTLEQLRGFRIGLERGEAWPNQLFHSDWLTTEVEDAEMLETMARANHIDVFFEIPEVMLFQNRKRGGAPLASIHINMPGAFIPYTFGLRRSFPSAEHLMLTFDQTHERLIARGGINDALGRFRS